MARGACAGRAMVAESACPCGRCAMRRRLLCASSSRWFRLPEAQRRRAIATDGTMTELTLTIRPEQPGDHATIERLHMRWAFETERFAAPPSAARRRRSRILSLSFAAHVRERCSGGLPYASVPSGRERSRRWFWASDGRARFQGSRDRRCAVAPCAGAGRAHWGEHYVCSRDAL